MRNKAGAALAALAVLGTSIAAVAAADSSPPANVAQERVQDTQLISRARDGSLPNGPSSNPVISNDRRWARIIAFQSEASDLVASDTNGVSDIFFIRRAGRFRNTGRNAGGRWRAGPVRLVSRRRGGPPADGASFGAAGGGALPGEPKSNAL